MLKRNYQDLRVYPSKDTLLEDEIDVVNMTVEQLLALGSYSWSLPIGSFALYGQKKGCSAKAIVTFNLRDGAGPVKSARYFNTFAQVEAAIGGIMSWPRCRMVCRDEPKNVLFGELPPGVYGLNETQVVVANTTLGRFMVSFHSHGDYGQTPLRRRFDLQVALSVVQSLAMMNENDVVLQLSLHELLKNCPTEDNLLEGAKAFFTTKLPEVTVWHLRHDDKPRALYFS